MSEKVKVCEFCEEQSATVLCAECCRCYCDECSKLTHAIGSKKGHKVDTLPKGVTINARCPIHNDNPLEMFCIDEVKLCCGICAFEESQKGHRIIKLLDIENDGEVYPTNEVKKRFADASKTCSELKRKIDTVIEDIQKENELVKERITETFRAAHEKLNDEETGIMKELERACNETEESLQDVLISLKEASEYNAQLRDADSKTLKPGNKLIELNIVSEMRKQTQLTESLSRRTLTDLKINWDGDERRISFTKSLINGTPVPYDISFSDVTCTDMKIAWKYDEGEGTGKRAPKFIVEMKKSIEGERGWEEVYSGRDKGCSASGLDVETEYNVRVKCVGRDLEESWSDPAFVKTKESGIKINSAILSSEENGRFLGNKLFEWCGSENLDLLYRGTRDGFDASDFHWKCDSQGKTLVLIKNTSGHVFGGFASVPWKRPSFGTNKRAPGSFLFTLTNMYGIEPTKFPLKSERDGGAVHHEIAYGPVFGDCKDLIIRSDCNANTDSLSNFPISYKDPTWKGYSVFSSDTGSNHFQVQEIEVFRVNTN